MSDSIRALRSIHFGVVDLEQASEFFTKAWGLSAVDQDDAAIYLRGTAEPHYVLALHKRPQTEVLRMDLWAHDRHAVDAIHARLALQKSDGLTAPGESDEPGGGYGFFVRDPEGRLLYIVAGDATHAEVTDGIDLPRKLSHITICTRQVERLEDFYVNALGGRIIDRTRTIHFVNYNSDHHSIALVPSPVTTLDHVAFELPNFDSLMRGLGRLRENDLLPGWGPGRHGPGNNIFAYFVGPEDLPIEYSTEFLQVDDSYRVRKPEEWAKEFPPGRRDLWGYTAPSTQEMTMARRTVDFSRSAE